MGESHNFESESHRTRLGRIFKPRWRQAKKFHSWVRVKDNSVNLIIDKGSAFNFDAQEVIDKLNFPTEKLPKPYEVTRSNGYVSPVTHRWLVSFKIGHYEDKIWCDVIHTNIAHVFFYAHGFWIGKCTMIKRQTHSFLWNGKRI